MIKHILEDGQLIHKHGDFGVIVQKKLTPQQRIECDEETEKIRENAKTAKFPHPFKAARFTHKNGHPRCLICGDEERLGGICRKSMRKAKVGKLGFKVGDKGSAVLQLHIVGLNEVEGAALNAIEKKILIARQDPIKLQELLVFFAYRSHEAHVDIRMSKEAAKSWEGGEILIEDVSGLDKLKKLHTQGKLDFEWKKEGGSLDKMLLGENSIHVFKSEEAGASELQSDALIQLEKLSWEIYLSDEHAKRIHFKSRYLKGNYLFAADDKDWTISRLKEADYDETIKKRLPEAVPIFKVDEDEQIVGGIVYEPRKTDAQGDYSTEDEIRQACYYFMEHTRKFKLQHEGTPITKKINILENYIVPKDFEIGAEKIQKGSWILIIRVLDAALWKLVKEGTITGFSMAGVAHRRKKKEVE